MEEIKNRFGKLIEHCLVPEQRVRGRLESELLSADVEGSFLVGPDGIPNLALDVPVEHCPKFEAHASMQLRFDGICVSGDSIRGEGFYANSCSSNPEKSEETARWYLAFGRTSIIHATTEENKGPFRLRLYLLNFPFSGESKRTSVSQATTTSLPDTFEFSAFGRQWAVHQMPGYKDRLSSLSFGWMRKCITAEMVVDLGPETDQVDQVLEQASTLIWLFSVASANRVNLCAWALENSVGQQFSKTFVDTVTPEYNRAWRHVDNHPAVQMRLTEFVEQSHNNFFALRQSFGFEIFVDLLYQSLRSLPLELKVASMIFALEHLCGNFAIQRLGKTAKDLESSNVVQKLKMLNGSLRFIPKEMTDDSLRANVRNPLMHTGTIVDLTSRELDELHKKLVRLALQIFFRIVGYTGCFYDPADRFAPVRVP